MIKSDVGAMKTDSSDWYREPVQWFEKIRKGFRCQAEDWALDLLKGSLMHKKSLAFFKDYLRLSVIIVKLGWQLHLSVCVSSVQFSCSATSGSL